jgi:hypothetical protein
MKRVLTWAMIMVGLAVVVALIVKGYSLSWTGFGPSVNEESEPVPPKKLWDWLDLLIVPVFLALGAWLLDGSQGVG